MIAGIVQEECHDGALCDTCYKIDNEDYLFALAYKRAKRQEGHQINDAERVFQDRQVKSRLRYSFLQLRRLDFHLEVITRERINYFWSNN